MHTTGADPTNLTVERFQILKQEKPYRQRRCASIKETGINLAIIRTISFVIWCHLLEKVFLKHLVTRVDGKAVVGPVCLQ